ncbi:peroxiredoxin [Streptomyces sp. NPDC056333]|uniref:peroxiredoxin n=1 Tax=Streptomyces sp. NPDC056333 TaxID=3345786 RepID=UPI0035D9320D
MGSSPQVGQPVQDFTLPGGTLTGDTFERSDYTLSAARGRTVVLAFYPGDNTTVCTKQLCSYSSGMETFNGLDAEVWGISPQGVDSHESFARTYGLRMPLLADTGREIARAYGITAPGIGVRRAVFLIGPDGVLRWKHVAVLGATFQSLDTLAEHIAGIESPTGGPGSPAPERPADDGGTGTTG